MDIGFIGLGQMGAGMAARLVSAGHAVTVWNRDRVKTEPLARLGATVAETPAQAARTGTVLTILADDAALEAVSAGPDGILSAGPDILHISSSTVSVAITDSLAHRHSAAGQRFVSAQVVGRPDAATAGMLSVIAAGADADLAQAQPLFEAIGQRVLRMGREPAMAAATKIAANASIAAIVETLTEAFTISGARGVSPAAMLDMFEQTGFAARIFSNYGRLIVDQRFEPPGFPIRLGRKDVGLALDAAGPDADIPVARLIAERIDRIIAAGGGERDWAALGLVPR